MNHIIQKNTISPQESNNISLVIIDQDITGHIQIPHGATTHILLLVLGSSLDITCDFIQENSDVHIHCLLLGAKKNNASATIHMTHTFPSTSSQVTIAAIAKDNDNFGLYGTIYIPIDVPKTSGHLHQETLVLGSQAKIRNKPVLDIRSNDVRASHAAKIDRLDPQKLFYMQCKGLSLLQSQDLLIDSYITSFLEPIKGSQQYEEMSQYIKSNLYL